MIPIEILRSVPARLQDIGQSGPRYEAGKNHRGVIGNRLVDERPCIPEATSVSLEYTVFLSMTAR
ncbi:hypothetical protein NY08_2942 [Rhodococcus sp. B7740]|nr:hypothetical protein NY08_2942 [Rhodococcus sp. B7740]